MNKDSLVNRAGRIFLEKKNRAGRCCFDQQHIIKQYRSPLPEPCSSGFADAKFQIYYSRHADKPKQIGENREEKRPRYKNDLAVCPEI